MTFPFSLALWGVNLVSSSVIGPRSDFTGSGCNIGSERWLSNFARPVYSIVDDPRAEGWAATLPTRLSETDLQRIIPVRAPLLHVVLGVDLSNPNDLLMIDLMFYEPMPVEVHIAPVAINGSAASVILADCLDTVYESPVDRTRLRDFLAALNGFAGVFGSGNLARVREREAIMACQLFAKDLPRASAMLGSLPVKSAAHEKHGLSASSAVINGVLVANATVERLYPALLAAQGTYVISRLKNEL